MSDFVYGGPDGRVFQSGDIADYGNGYKYRYDFSDSVVVTTYLENNTKIHRSVLIGNFTYSNGIPAGPINRSSDFSYVISGPSQGDEDGWSLNLPNIQWNDYPAFGAQENAASANYFYSNDGYVYKGAKFSGLSTITDRSQLDGLPDTQYAKNGWWANPFEFTLDTALPSVTVVAIANGNEANGSPVVFRFERTGNISAALSIGYQLFGTTQAGSDYSGSSTGTISFAAGSATASLSLPALADGALIDPGETIIARINPSESYAITPGKQFATATITAEGMVVSPELSTLPLKSGREQAIGAAFAALKSDGTVVTWGYGSAGSTAPQELSGVTQVFSSTGGAFAALKSDGTVASWGDSRSGGTAP